jgi:anti-sigma factor RsiW
MMTDWTERLSEYLDGSLSPVDAAACEAWLAANADGRELLEELRMVVAHAKTMPDAEVPASVWTGVVAAIRAQPRKAGELDQVVPLELGRHRSVVSSRRWSLTPIQFAAAAIVVLTLGIAAGLALRTKVGGTDVALMPRPGRPITTGVTTTLVASDPNASPVASRANVSYDRAVQELQGILDRNRATLDTSTVRVLEKSLASIDTALVEAQRALVNDPHNAYLNDHLSRIKRKKLDLLRQGASLVQAS